MAWLMAVSEPLSLSDPELLEVVVHVLVGQQGPFLGAHLSKEGMDLCRNGIAFSGEAVDHFYKALLFRGEVLLVRHDEFFGSGKVAG